MPLELHVTDRHDFERRPRIVGAVEEAAVHEGRLLYGHPLGRSAGCQKLKPRMQKSVGALRDEIAPVVVCGMALISFILAQVAFFLTDKLEVASYSALSLGSLLLWSPRCTCRKCWSSRSRAWSSRRVLPSRSTPPLGWASRSSHPERRGASHSATSTAVRRLNSTAFEGSPRSIIFSVSFKMCSINPTL